MPSVHRHRPELAIDHLVVAARSLSEGTAWLRERVGVDAQAGGAHVRMGTHNALVGLGPRVYVEVIAIDPAASAPGRPRWFSLDDPGMRARLAEGPALVHWVVRTRDIDSDATRADLGSILTMARGDFRWRITVPDDGQLPKHGLVPTLIQWSDARHPADGLANAGLSLIALAAEHPEPAPVRRALEALGLSEILKVSYGRSPRLAAMLRTPRGLVTL